MTGPRDRNLLEHCPHFMNTILVLERNKTMLCSEDNEQSVEKYNKVLKQLGRPHPEATVIKKSLYQWVREIVRSCIAWIKSFFRID
ncbi:uncharacterized protein NESG_01141 [Nematocida ausubeli]|uniref:Uncharacterized protein n=1 Tax=Nematocida ausubeli (strain ATCC PRA-371 / ERTm2) TaxID=1913371 RepID=A0A086J1L1_NEMA1|nr:uncharacterized protein NESG_01141 [Nematocida ausubeli]KFG26029.1 hypothetical protein NESG_01141 [Nematocida ausubeli]